MAIDPHHDQDKPVMFHGIRYGRPGQSKFDAKVFLIILVIAAVITLLIDLFTPAAPPRAEAPEAPDAAIRVVIPRHHPEK